MRWIKGEEVMWENKEFRIRLEENSMKDFEKIMLTSGAVSYTHLLQV